MNPSTLNNWMSRAKPKKDNLKSGAEGHKDSSSATASKYTQEILSTLSQKPGDENNQKESRSKDKIAMEQDLFSDEVLTRLREQKRSNSLENTGRGIPKRAARDEKVSQKHETIEQLRKENARLSRQRDTYREVVILLAMQGEEGDV